MPPKLKVYRKHTHSDSYIHAFSNHSNKVKQGVISNMFLRAYKICDNEFIDNEITHIKRVFSKHGYSANFIDRAHSKAKKKYYSDNENIIFLRENYKILILPHINANTQNTIKRCLRGCNIVTINRNTNTIRKTLKKVVKPPNEINPVIYEIPCKNCNKVYIEETTQI